MSVPKADAHDMASVKERLDQIVEAVSDDNLDLDEALTLYEEAVKLGMKASELMEADLVGTLPADDAQDTELDAATRQGREG